MFDQAGMHHAPEAEVRAVLDRLRDDDWRVFVLPPGIDTKEGFFNAVAAVMPLDPPSGGGYVWDALSDSLWGGLDRLNNRRIAIGWPDALVLADSDPASYEIALSILADLPRSLGSDEATVGSPKTISVLVGG